MERTKGLLKEINAGSLNWGRRFEIPQGKNVMHLPDAVDWAESGELTGLTAPSHLSLSSPFLHSTCLMLISSRRKRHCCTIVLT